MDDSALPSLAAGGRPRGQPLADDFDGVVMLTWSDWHQEPRSNRYHYATRFARSLPVLFVQPDGMGSACTVETTGVSGVSIVHFPAIANDILSGQQQAERLGAIMARRGIRRPLLWVYNSFMGELVRRCYAPLKVYHATEDYFESERLGNWRGPAGVGRACELRDTLTQVLKQIDLIVAVSDGVADSYRKHTGFGGPIQLAANGCDYEFLAGIGRATGLPHPGTRIALFQGGINWRVDFDLIREISTLLPDWEFQLCGREAFDARDRRCRASWQALKKRPNVRYLGFLNPEETARAMLRATVGLIPFVRERAIVERSLPLKAFEYVACGLPVVSIPLRQLAGSPELFAFADSAAEFAEKITGARDSRWQPGMLRLRAEQAARRSYEAAFTGVCSAMRDTLGNRPPAQNRRNVLVIYEAGAWQAFDSRRQLEDLRRFSRHELLFLPLARAAARFDLGVFDALLVHRSLLTGEAERRHAAFHQQLRATPSLKAALAFPGEEQPADFKRRCRQLGLHVPAQHVPARPEAWSVADRGRLLVAAWDDWLAQALPRSGNRLITVLAGYETGASQRCQLVLPPSADWLNQAPLGDPCPPAPGRLARASPPGLLRRQRLLWKARTRKFAGRTLRFFARLLRQTAAYCLFMR